MAMAMHGSASLVNSSLGRALITPLVKRWWQERQTFHLVTGEAIVTLHNVTLLFGLCVRGDAVTGTIPTCGPW